MLSILAGFLIGVGAIVNLSVGGPVGALLFAVGLMTICHYKLELFTGKIGLIPSREITIVKLIEIWIGNFIGTWIAASLIIGSPKYEALRSEAAAILQTRLNNGLVSNFVLGIFCGMLMFIAVNGYATSGKLTFVYIPVAVFILAGFNHCVADMFYTHLAAINLLDYQTLIPTTLGNIVGGVAIPYVKILDNYSNC